MKRAATFAGFLLLASCAAKAPVAPAPAPAPTATPAPAAPAPAPGPAHPDLKVTLISATSDSDTFLVSRDGAAWVRDHLDEALAGAQLADHTTGGVRIVSLADDSLVAKVGFQAGDVLRSLNGQPVVDRESMATLAKSDAVRRATALVAGIERAGQIRAIMVRSAPH